MLAEHHYCRRGRIFTAESDLGVEIMAEETVLQSTSKSKRCVHFFSERVKLTKPIPLHWEENQALRTRPEADNATICALWQNVFLLRVTFTAYM